MNTLHYFEAFKHSVGVDVNANANAKKDGLGDSSVFHTQIRDRDGRTVIGHNNGVCLHGHFRDYCQG